jgi:hypothetical protein
MRRSGKTFRLVLKSLVSASEGYFVIFVTNTIFHAEIAIKLARQCSFNYLSSYMDVPIKENIFRFDSGGSLRVITDRVFKTNAFNTNAFNLLEGRNKEKIIIVYDF